MGWIYLSLAAAFFYAFRYIIIKKHLSSCDTAVITFAARFFGALFITPALFFVSIPAGASSPLFWKTILATATLTGIASMMQFHSIKKHEISSSLPFISFVPLFMVFFVYIIFGELPDPRAAGGMIFLCAGAFVINGEAGSPAFSTFLGASKNPGAILFFLASIILGLTTALDRLAIVESGAGGLAYTIFWNVFSALLFSAIFLNPESRRGYVNQIAAHPCAFTLQGFFGIAAFASQMLAVECARDVSANVIYVKTLTLLQLFIGVIFGIAMFGEKNPRKKIAGSLLMLSGAIIITLFAKK
ncbi:MAG TPA: DMT family transporter [Candidatus Wallbacteria bacterium]|nr:DMT family transporter [Candidatus Wallbacteria bacterium]